MIAKAVESTM